MFSWRRLRITIHQRFAKSSVKRNLLTADPKTHHVHKCNCVPREVGINIRSEASGWFTPVSIAKIISSYHNSCSSLVENRQILTKKLFKTSTQLHLHLKLILCNSCPRTAYKPFHLGLYMIRPHASDSMITMTTSKVSKTKISVPGKQMSRSLYANSSTS